MIVLLPLPVQVAASPVSSAPAMPSAPPDTIAAPADGLSNAAVSTVTGPEGLLFNRNSGLWNRMTEGGDGLDSLLVRAPAVEDLLTRLQTPAWPEKLGVTTNNPLLEDLVARIAQNVAPVTEGGTVLVTTPYFNGAVTALKIVKGSGGILYGYDIYNGGSAIAFLQIFNSTSAVLGTDTPILSIPVLPTGTALRDANVPIASFPTAISIGATTTATGGTVVSTALVVNLYYI